MKNGPESILSERENRTKKFKILKAPFSRKKTCKKKKLKKKE